MADFVIQPANSLLREKEKNEIITKIVTRIQEFPQFHSLKTDMELLLMCCQIVEHLVVKVKDAKKKHCKKDIVLKSYERAFGALTPAEKETLEKGIEFLWDNGKIKKLASHKIAFACVADWFRRRVF